MATFNVQLNIYKRGHEFKNKFVSYKCITYIIVIHYFYDIIITQSIGVNMNFKFTFIEYDNMIIDHKDSAKWFKV